MAIESWHLDPTHSELKFKLRHLIVTEISGHVRRWRGSLHIDPRDPNHSSVEATLEAASIDTGDRERDEHIRSAEFLNVVKFPRMTFRSTSLRPKEGKKYTVVGDLTIRDVTRTVMMEVEELGRRIATSGGPMAAFRAHASVNRQHFGLHWNQDLDSGGVVLGDKVEVEIVVEAVLDTADGHPISRTTQPHT